MKPCRNWENADRIGGTMRKTNQRVPRDRQIRRREWRLYAGDLKEFFGCVVRIGNQGYQLEGWIQQNPTNRIYAIRESDGEPLVMSVADVDTNTQWYSQPGKRRKVRQDLN
jgi:hypothetical protein